jgi:peroxiredoxin
VQQRYDEFRHLGAEVLVVTQARPELLAAFLRGQPLPFPAAADPGRVAYRVFGLERTSWWTMLRPGGILRYLRLIFRGWRPQQAREGEDILQLGGDFVLDREGRLIYAYRSAEPTDRPSVEALLQAVRDIPAPASPSDESALAE